jgi:nucleoside-diphosphate-sugar epimerase
LSDVIVVTGGAGYIGVPLCLNLAASGRKVRALDVLLHDQGTVLPALEQAGVELIEADIRSPAAREQALT